MNSEQKRALRYRHRGCTSPKEKFTEEEREKLANHCTNLESPVFGLINLPETVKGALFARYSRYQGSLRRLFLDEFADGLPDIGDLPKLSEGRRAAELYERVFIGFGDDSVAQLGRVHLACEWTSNLMTKILQRPRLAAYKERVCFGVRLSNTKTAMSRPATSAPSTM